jgi:hypothetical protein
MHMHISKKLLGSTYPKTCLATSPEYGISFSKLLETTSYFARKQDSDKQKQKPVKKLKPETNDAWFRLIFNKIPNPLRATMPMDELRM